MLLIHLSNLPIGLKLKQAVTSFLSILTDWETSMEHYPFGNRTFGATTRQAQFFLTQEKAKTFLSILLRQLWKN